jgi:hypothetical protein
MLEAGVRMVGDLSGMEVDTDDFDSLEQEQRLH